MEDVSKYPEVFAALIENTEFEWTDADLAKLANGNLVRTLRQVEEVRGLLVESGVRPDNHWIPLADLGNDTSCNSDFPL